MSLQSSLFLILMPKTENTTLLATLFAFFIALLMVGCGEEGTKPLDSIPESNQSYVETNPTKPASDAKIDLGEIETVNRIAAESIDRHEILSVAAGGLTQGLKLQKRIKDGEELLFAPNQQTPFTGSAAWYNDNGKLSKVSQFKNGKLHGLSTRWYESGQKKSEENYKDGKRDGPWTRWYTNGQKSMEQNYKDGKQDGLSSFWYENGQKMWEMNYKEGKIMSAEAWKPNGEKCPVTNYKDGNGVVVKYNDDGTEKVRMTFKDGKPVRD
mgnify:CR=1 FL=1